MPSAQVQAGFVSGERYIDHDSFARLVAQAANGLQSLGVKPGDMIGILMRNDIAFLVAMRAIMDVGANPVPLNWHATPSDCAYILNDCAATALIVHADLLRNVEAALPPACRPIAVATPPEVAAAYGLTPDACAVPAGQIDWDRWLSGMSTDFTPIGDMRVAVQYTSGTTGRPKGVIRQPVTGEAATRLRTILDEVFGVAASEPVRTLINGPLYHGGQNLWSTRSWNPGSLIVLQPRFEPEETLRLIERYRITHSFLVPTMMIRLLKLPPEVRQRYDLSSLRRVGHSAAPVSREVKAAMIEWLGPVISEFYGGTENGCVAIVESPEWLARPGTVGRAMTNCEIRIYDDEGNVLKPGEVGEIFAYNFNFSTFDYLNLPEERRVNERDGLFSIGDVGYLDEDGYLFLCDRKKDMVISGGVNIYPAEIEKVLETMPGVQDSAVFGIPDPEYGEVVCAHVQPEAGAALTADEVLSWLRTRLAKQLLPRKIVIVDALPREASGKIMKRRIRDLYWQDQARMI